MCSKVFIYLSRQIFADEKEYLRGDTDNYNWRCKGSKIVRNIRMIDKINVNMVSWKNMPPDSHSYNGPYGLSGYLLRILNEV